MRLSIVLLPHPDGPMRETNSPRSGTSSIVNETSCNAVNVPKRTVTLRNSMMGGSGRLDSLTMGADTGTESVPDVPRQGPQPTQSV